MFAQKLANFLQSIAPDTYKEIFNRGQKEAILKIEKINEDENQLRREAKMFAFEEKFPIGGFVVSIPNEEVDPVVGRITEYYFGNDFTDPILKVYDYVKQEEFVVPCTTFPFNETILGAVMAQNAQQRHASYYGGNGKKFTDPEDLTPDLETMKSILTKNGFYRDLENWENEK